MRSTGTVYPPQKCLVFLKLYTHKWHNALWKDNWNVLMFWFTFKYVSIDLQIYRHGGAGGIADWPRQFVRPNKRGECCWNVFHELGDGFWPRPCVRSLSLLYLILTDIANSDKTVTVVGGIVFVLEFLAHHAFMPDELIPWRGVCRLSVVCLLSVNISCKMLLLPHFSMDFNSGCVIGWIYVLCIYLQHIFVKLWILTNWQTNKVINQVLISIWISIWICYLKLLDSGSELRIWIHISWFLYFDLIGWAIVSFTLVFLQFANNEFFTDLCYHNVLFNSDYSLCEGCGQQEAWARRVHICNLPDSLIFMMKRFRMNEDGGITKINLPVQLNRCALLNINLDSYFTCTFGHSYRVHYKPAHNGRSSKSEDALIVFRARCVCLAE